MRINSNMPAAAGGVDSSLVDRIMEVERAPIEAAKARKERVVTEKNEYTSLQGMLSGLDGVVNGMRAPGGFRAMTVESSHPDILNGVVEGLADPGTYEFEVRGLAQADKHLDIGFPDLKSEVGFGFMEIARDDGSPMELTIDPGSTLQDVAAKINDAKGGVRASIVNTGMPENPFRLLVASEKTGEAARINIDADTTFLEMDNIKKGRNLDVMFEDVAVTRADNKLNDLLPGLKLDAKRSEPGTRVTVNVTHDLDKTALGVKEFTEKYNEIARYANTQFQVDPATGHAGGMSKDGNLRQVMRQLQAQVATRGEGNPGSKFQSLAEVGIKTNAKSGELEVDESKLKAALTEDYDGVSALFADKEGGQKGLASRMSDALKGMRDPVTGPVNSRLKSLDRMISEQDKAIEKQTVRAAEREEALQRKFSALNNRLSGLESQGEFMQARFGSASAAGGSGNGGATGG